MKTIIHKDEIFKVTNKEFGILQKLEVNIIRSAGVSEDYYVAEEMLINYLEENIHKYRYCGTVDWNSIFLIR